jgi:hypothetical protein
MLLFIKKIVGVFTAPKKFEIVIEPKYIVKTLMNVLNSH